MRRCSWISDRSLPFTVRIPKLFSSVTIWHCDSPRNWKPSSCPRIPAEVLTELAEQREPLVITQHGEAKAVLQDVASFEETQETLALLKILALGNQDVEAGRVKPVADVVARLRANRRTA
jgi:prevent-host-death family protein